MIPLLIPPLSTLSHLEIVVIAVLQMRKLGPRMMTFLSSHSYKLAERGAQNVLTLVFMLDKEVCLESIHPCNVKNRDIY